jgi:AcrR family transcriptional regulator
MTPPLRSIKTPRLSAEDWARGGLKLLMAEGITAVRINRLCQELGVTRGSFYWHFADLDELREKIADLWCGETREALARLAELDRLPPRERLSVMTLRLTDDSSWAVERALREWGRSDEKVAGVVAESDLFVLSLVEGAFTELGLPSVEARVRAGVLVYAGIGFAHGQSGLPKPNVDEVERMVALFTKPV